jgi:hypothetical protein
VTVAPPPGHEERKQEIAEIKDEILPVREKRAALLAQLAAVPEQTSKEAIEQRKTLRDQIHPVDEDMIARLTKEIEHVDAALAALRAALPAQSAPGTPAVPDPLWKDLHDLEADKKAAEAERKAIERGRAREEIRAIEEQIAQLPGGDPARKDLDARKKALGEMLSGTAEHRAPAGQVGTAADGRGYVVYQHQVKLGGSLPWRNNNPGNVQRSPSGGDPSGVLGVDQYKHYIFNSWEEGKAAVFVDLQNRRGGPGATLAKALHSYIGGSVPENELPEDEAECKRRGIPLATCATKKSVREYPGKVAGGVKPNALPLDKKLGELSDDERSALVDSILIWEGGISGAKGEDFTCGQSSGAKDVRALLGCDE